MICPETPGHCWAAASDGTKASANVSASLRMAAMKRERAAPGQVFFRKNFTK